LLKNIPHLLVYFDRSLFMSSPLQREALVDVIERCAWLTEYYDRTGVAPQSVDVLKSTMYRAMIDLQALSPSMYTDSCQLRKCDQDLQI